MSNLDLVQKRIDDFLVTDAPEVLCLRGSWGVGKTYAWRQFYQAAVAAQKVSLQRYSYVSMFGISSLDALKAATFENMQVATDGKNETLIETLKGGANSALSAGGKFLASALQVAADLGGVGALGAAGEAILFGSVRKQIICIDDLERTGEGLNVRDVMGYISFMKEERDCKVVLILNDRQLTDEAAAQFSQDFEKVVDQSILMDPQPSEVARIALGPGQSALAEKVSALGITNFRVIEKINRALRLCDGVLRQFDDEVAAEAATTLAILGWSFYRAEGAPPISFMRGLAEARRSRSIRTITGGDVAERSAEEERWYSILDTYRFEHLDDFDDGLLRVLESGYCDPDDLIPLAASKQQDVTRKRGQVLLKEAWAKYHDSFDDDLEFVVASFHDAVSKYASSMSVGDVFQVAELLWGLGQHEEAEFVISSFASSRDGSGLAYEEHLFSRYVRSEGLAKKVRDALGNGKPNVAADALSMFRALDIGSWDEAHLEKLAALSIGEYVASFHQLRGEELTNIGRACLQWRNVSNPSEAMASVQMKAETALRKIAAESRLNNSRMSKFGLDQR